MDGFLRKHKRAASQGGEEWAQGFYKDEEGVVEHMENCQAEQRIKSGKGRGVLCAVLGACLSCGQRETEDSPPPSERIADVQL